MEEDDKVALTGTIGTWVAVVLALLALIVVIGPVLVWAAARTERNRALHHADDTNHSFISTGIRFPGLDVRLLRHVRVPILDKDPMNPEPKWDIAHFTESKSGATWIQLANILLGYGIPLQKGDNLVIYRGRALLPIHRIWLLVICLSGRYSTTRKSPLNPKRSITRHLTGSVRFRTPEVDSRDEDFVDSSPWSFQTSLNGATGQIKVSEKVPGLGLSDSPIVVFSPRPVKDLAGIETEKLSMQDLLMLASGCIPTPSSQYIALVDLWTYDDLYMRGSRIVREDLRISRGIETSEALADVITHGNSESLQGLSAIQRSTARSRRSPSRFEVDIKERQEPVALRLERVVDRDAEMDRLRNSLGQMKELLAFEPQNLGLGLLEDFKMHVGTTFIDPSCDWIRIPQFDDWSDRLSNVFIWRTDAQKVAFALLKLPWHPQGYLIGGGSSA